MTCALTVAATCLFCITKNMSWPILHLASASCSERERFQAENRFIALYEKKRAFNSSLCGIFPESWTAQGLCDFLLPPAASLAAWTGQAVHWR